PVIAEAAFRKIKSYLEIGHREGHLITGGGVCDTKGWFIEPTIFIDCPYDAVIMKQEIFGPVLAIAKAPSFGEALRAANNTEYGLTGAVFSKCRENLELARREFHVGNLYFNRKCTGALVGYQPFGGFNMSGTDSKAGGPDYLILHMQGKTVTEQF
ncbi:MAG: aldehyde dehydrogenase family protein, partial [Bacilli bacterium]|nr:aldehyde dehydrogenase family protein [Bacilli bacterium]